MSMMAMVLGGLLALMMPVDGGQKLTPEQETDLTRFFGFGPFQIYKIKPGIQQLKLADLDGDGRTDIALWNPYQSRIELFYQPDPNAPKSAASAEPPAGAERNEIANRGNMIQVNVPVTSRISGMDIADLTGDGRADIVFFGEPKEVVILPGKKEGGFGPAIGTRAAEGNPRHNGFCLGDFNGDQRKDVAILGDDAILIFYRKPEGGLMKPIRIVHSVKQPLMMLTTDLNGDGRDDVIIGTDDNEYGAYVCLQEPAGGLGPMRKLRVPNFRSMTIAKAAGGDDLFAIESATGRLKQYRWEAPKDAAIATDWPQRLYCYPIRSKSKQKPVAVGDVTGDKLADVVAADPDAAQLILFKQGPNGLEAGVAFPGLAKTVDLCVADIDGDGAAEVLSVSAEEKMIGVSHYVDQRLTFPTMLATNGQPLVVAVGGLKAGAPSDMIACLARDESKEMAVHVINAKEGTEKTKFTVKDLEDDPSGIRFADVNQDGLNDLLVFVKHAPLRTFLQKEDGQFEALSGAATRDGLVKDAALEGFCMADVTGDGKPEVLLAQKKLARALMVKEGRWTVVDQYNPETADAVIMGLAALRGQEAGNPTITLYDKNAGDLLVLKRRADRTYAVTQSIPVGAFDLTLMEAAPLSAGGQPALLLADANMLAVLSPDETAPTLVEKHSYETAVKDARLADSVVGDLNHDGVRDVVAMDVAKANLEILTTLPDGELVKAMRFQVFQGKRFADAPDRQGEPHEILIGDVTGDKIDDLVVLVHDRLIVYPGQ